MGFKKTFVISVKSLFQKIYCSFKHTIPKGHISLLSGYETNFLRVNDLVPRIMANNCWPESLGIVWSWDDLGSTMMKP